MLLHRIYKNRCEGADHDDPEHIYRFVGTVDIDNIVDSDSIFGGDDHSETI